MFPIRRTSGAWRRDVLALRVIPVLPNGMPPDARHPRDAGWLARHDARIAALGVAIGYVAGDEEEIRVRVVRVHHLSVPIIDGRPAFGGNDTAEQEAVLLHGIADQITRFDQPLMVTVGGRQMDLTFLRYRAFAKGVSVSGLHTSVNGRLSLFDRFDLNWHIDLADLLSTTGASYLLPLEELCRLGCIARAEVTADFGVEAETEVLAVFAVFIRTLWIAGTLSSSEYQIARETIEGVRRPYAR
jgi:hypothetical protein